MVLPVSVCLSVCGIRVLWLPTLTRIKNSHTTKYSGDITRRNHKPNNLSLGEVPQFSGEAEVGVKKAILGAENRKYLWSDAI